MLKVKCGPMVLFKAIRLRLFAMTDHFGNGLFLAYLRCDLKQNKFERALYCEALLTVKHQGYLQIVESLVSQNHIGSHKSNAGSSVDLFVL